MRHELCSGSALFCSVASSFISEANVKYIIMVHTHTGVEANYIGVGTGGGGGTRGHVPPHVS